MRKTYHSSSFEKLSIPRRNNTPITETCTDFNLEIIRSSQQIRPEPCPWFLYQPESSDTLQGILLKFNVKMNELRKMNPLNQVVSTKTKLRIPLTKEAVKQGYSVDGTEMHIEMNHKNSRLKRSISNQIHDSSRLLADIDDSVTKAMSNLDCICDWIEEAREFEGATTRSYQSVLVSRKSLTDEYKSYKKDTLDK